MRPATFLKCFVTLSAALLPPHAWSQSASFMDPIAGKVASTPSFTATQNVLALNNAMFDLYGAAGRVFQQNIRANHPLILGMFSGAGGRFMLYRPGQPVIEAPPVPMSYQLMKSVGHSTMALAEVVTPYLDNPANQDWLASLLAFRSPNRRVSARCRCCAIG